MNTAERVVAIMNTMADAGGPIGISDISRKLEIGKNNIFRILSALQIEGWVYQDDRTKKYGLTGAMARVAYKALSQLDIQEISLPFLHDLQAETGETSALSIKVDYERIFINSITSNRNIRHVVPMGESRKLWFGSGGKAILAFLPEEEIETVLNQFEASGVSTLASGQQVTVELLRDELDKIREQGYAIAAGERNIDACGISAPIFNHKMEVVGSISVSGPQTRFDKEKALQFSPLLVETAEKISITLGAAVKQTVIEA